ncbi:MAG TPA: MBL fold metallo-hydrolase [Bryobacteraceae bacterium]|nr:MBL fold metallo-hydrolase [Bryobacteraceae bacterium]
MHNHTHSHTHPHPSRRDFFAGLLQTSLAGAGVLKIARYRAAWAQALAPAAASGLFEIQKVADDVYFALARPWALPNSNAAIFVNSSDVLVVDAHSHPAAAAALIAQIKSEITPKPVRYVVDSHFHFDHTQGNRAYLNTGNKVDIVASKTTKILMSQLLVPRLKAALDASGPQARGSQVVARQIEDLRQRAGKSTSQAEKDQLQQRISQLESFAAEMKDFKPALPTVTFDKTYVIKEKGYDLHLEFHGLAHTAGDIVVFCPQKRVIASGDAIHPGFPTFIDAYPQPWPKTIDSVAKLQFDHTLPGHGRVQHDRKDMTGQRNYIEELTERVIAGKKAGQPVADLQRTVTAASLKSLHVEGYAIAATPEAMERGVKSNIDDMYDRVEKTAFTGNEPLRLRE